MIRPRAHHRAAVASLLLAACSAAEPETRRASGDSVAASAPESTPAPATAAGTAPGAEPLRTAHDLIGHSWQELERDPERGEWINPAPGLAVAFPGDEPTDGIAADDPADPTRSLEVFPNRRITADGRALAESRLLSIRGVRVEAGVAVLEAWESYRLAAEPDDRLGTRGVRVRVSPLAGEKGIYRWEFAYAGPDPCAARQPCPLRQPLWVGALGTRYFERRDPDDGHPLDQSESGDGISGSPS